jgi:hypothetical protein
MTPYLQDIFPMQRPLHSDRAATALCGALAVLVQSTPALSITAASVIRLAEATANWNSGSPILFRYHHMQSLHVSPAREADAPDIHLFHFVDMPDLPSCARTLATAELRSLYR